MDSFRNRDEAGQALAGALDKSGVSPDTLVLALPRGGVPIAAVIAEQLGLEMDVLNVRKLGVPWQPELAMGALAEDGTLYLNSSLIQTLRITNSSIEEVSARERGTLVRRAALFRDGTPAPVVRGRPVILVDDGLATGATMEVAVNAVRHQQPAEITVAVPVAARGSREHFSRLADRFVCILEPAHFEAVGRWYMDFDQVSDEEVLRLLRLSRDRHGGPRPG